MILYNNKINYIYAKIKYVTNKMVYITNNVFLNGL